MFRWLGIYVILCLELGNNLLEIIGHLFFAVHYLFEVTGHLHHPVNLTGRVVDFPHCSCNFCKKDIVDLFFGHPGKTLRVHALLTDYTAKIVCKLTRCCSFGFFFDYCKSTLSFQHCFLDLEHLGLFPRILTVFNGKVMLIGKFLHRLPVVLYGLWGRTLDGGIGIAV